MKAQRRVQLYTFFNLSARWGGWSSRPGRFTPGKDPVPTVQVAEWAHRAGGLDGCGKPRPEPGFDPRTVQLVASRYTD